LNHTADAKIAHASVNVPCRLVIVRGWWLLVVCASGCRVGFDMQEPVLDDAHPDLGPIEAGATRTEAWGEDSAADHRSVTTDTYLDSELGKRDNNYGAATSLSFEGNPLLRFDLSALAKTSRILSASLRVSISGSQHGAIDVYPVLEAWTGGTQNGTLGVASYNQRTAGTAWSSPGCGAPSSRSGESAAEFPPNVTGEQTIDLPAPLVEAWIGAPSDNYGITLVQQSGDDTRIVSSEGTDGSRPRLVLTYLP